MATFGNVAGAVSFAYQTVLSVIGWIQIPQGRPVAIHFTGTELEADNFASKPIALLAIPVDILIAVVLALAHSLIVFRAL